MHDITVTTEFTGLNIPDYPETPEIIGMLIDCALGFATAHFDQFRDFSTGVETGDPNPDIRVQKIFGTLTIGGMFELLNARSRSYQ